MAELEQSHPVTVTWHAFELRPAGAPPIPPEYRAQIEAGRPQLYERARRDYGVELNPGPFGVDSRPALIGAKYAEAQGKGPAYHDRVLRGYWQQAEDISDPATLRQMAHDAGLDPDAFHASLTDPAYIEQVDHDIALAGLYQLRGVPAIVLQNKYLIPGAVPYETLRQAVEQVA